MKITDIHHKLLHPNEHLNPEKDDTHLSGQTNEREKKNKIGSKYFFIQ